MLRLRSCCPWVLLWQSQRSAQEQRINKAPPEARTSRAFVQLVWLHLHVAVLCLRCTQLCLIIISSLRLLAFLLLIFFSCLLGPAFTSGLILFSLAPMVCGVQREKSPALPFHHFLPYSRKATKDKLRAYICITVSLYIHTIPFCTANLIHALRTPALMYCSYSKEWC